MLLLAALAAASTPAPTQAPTAARAFVRILNAARATQDEWRKLPEPQRREVTVREQDGRRVTVRLIDFE